MKKYIAIFLLTAVVVLSTTMRAEATFNPTVTICHTPSNPDQTLTVSLSALPAHLLHGDKVGACTQVTPTVTPTPTVEQEPTPTVTPTEEVAPTPDVTRTPPPTTTVARQDEVLTNFTTGTPSCSDLAPTRVNDIWLENDAAGNGELVVRWGTNASYDRVHIIYGFAPHDWRYALLNTEDDGREVIGGLDNNTHYWFAVQSVRGCSTGELSDWIDPLP